MKRGKKVFTEKNSYREMLTCENMQPLLECFAGKTICEFLSREENIDQPISVIEEKGPLPWGVMFSREGFLEGVNTAWQLQKEGKWSIVPVWNKEQKIPVQDSTENSVFFLTTTEMSNQPQPAVVICPGGGYEYVSYELEGIWFARRFVQAGYKPFVLNYRVSPNRYPLPQMDLAYTIMQIRKNAKQYGINPNRILVVGSSAGGHLAASVAALHKQVKENVLEWLHPNSPEMVQQYQEVSAKPDAVCLCYPVITFDEKHRHDGSYLALTGGEESLKKALSVETLVTPEYPKTYVWCCEDDAAVPPSNTTMLQKALEQQGVCHKMEVFPTGGHGCGLAAGTSAESWVQDMLDFMK